MSQISNINLTYQSPYEDIISSLGINPDGTTNIKYTLTSIRNLLQQNVNVLNSLLAEVDDITDIIPIGGEMISIKFNTNAIQKKLLENNVLIIPSINMEDSIEENYFVNDDKDETNIDRLNMVHNLINQNDIPNNIDVISYRDSDRDSDSDSEDNDILDDNTNIEAIIYKYHNIADISDSESGSDSEYEYDNLNNNYSSSEENDN